MNIEFCSIQANVSIPPPTTPVLQETMTSSPTVAEQPSVGLSIKEVQLYQRIL